VSVFRPSARATGPDGRLWEIYAYKIRVRDRPEFDPGLDELAVAPVAATGGFVLLDALLWILALIPRALLRLGDAAVAGVRALRSDEWTIEAVTFGAQPESIRWATTAEYRGQVLANVEGSIARGDTPRPRNATYLDATY
jgi:hypothetical protein